LLIEVGYFEHDFNQWTIIYQGDHSTIWDAVSSQLIAANYTLIGEV
jgi:hypothetical protein